MQILWLLVLPLFLVGCFSPGNGQSSRGLKLSEAMDSSAKGDQRDLGGQSHHEHSYSDDDDYGHTGVETSDFAAVSYDDGEYFWQVLMDVGYSRSFNSEIREMAFVGLTPVAFESDRHFLAWTLRGASVEYENGSLPDLATRSPWYFDTGLVYRWYLNHPQTGISPYLTGGANIGVMGWKYRNPIFVGGDVVNSDRLNAAGGFVGFGLATRRNSHLGLFAEVDLGGTVFWSETIEGFENDVFDDFGFFSVRAGVSIKF